MNWLAHVFLSEQNINFQIGNYLADPLKSKIWQDADENIIKGMQTHRLIDSFTDSHEIFKQSKNRLGKKGLLKPVLIDITYDYFLSKNWQLFCNENFEEFTSRFYSQANEVIELYPVNAQIPINRIIKNRVLNKYQSVEDVKTAFDRLDRRLSERLLKRETASSYFEIVNENINYLEKDFLEFFPQLCKKVKEEVNQNKLKHWNI